METIKFNNNSWHARLVARITNYFENYETPDICSYTRTVVWAIIKVLIGVIFLSLLVFSATTTLVQMLFFVFHFTFPNVLLFYAFLGAIVWGAIGGCLIASVMTIAGALVSSYIKNKIGMKVQKEPGAIKIMYKHWKEKTCKKVEFYEDTKENNGTV